MDRTESTNRDDNRDDFERGLSALQAHEDVMACSVSDDGGRTWRECWRKPTTEEREENT